MAAKRGKGSRSQRALERWRRIGTPLMRVVASIAVLVLLGVLASRLSGMARKDARFMVDPAAVLEENPPPWLPETIAALVRRDLGAAAPISIFAANFAEVMRDELVGASPWIAAVRGVERLFPNRARVELVLRRPLVAVEGPDLRYLVDGSGLVIHEEPRSRPSDFGYPVLPVNGVRLGTRPIVGRVIDDAEVVSATKVAAELLALDESRARILRQIRPKALEVRCSVQGAVAAQGEVHLRTANDVIVEWGRARDSVHHGLNDIPVTQKMEHLQKILEVFPGLGGLEEARLNFDLPHYRKIGGPLTFLRRPDPATETGSDS